MSAPCPSRDELQQFRSGRLTRDAMPPIEEHLKGCPACLAHLAGLTLHDPLLQALRGVSRRPRLNNPLLSQVQQELRAQPVRLEGAHQPTQGGPPRTIDATVGPGPDFSASSVMAFPFLGPPRGPGEIGWLSFYRVLRVLGQGGMGVVLLAEDTRLERQVALKVLRPLLAADGNARRRFLREARATARLSHDHIIPIHHIDEVEGVPYLAMQLLQGETLESRLQREGLLSIDEVLRIGREIAEGLSVAHQSGLIHRDIKPSNLWLEHPNSRVKILDFGLAAMPAAEEKTLPGTILGTPGYMAPEQTEGQADHRADLFSLGCVLYRMATGQPAFKGGTMMEKIRSTLFETPAPPRQINPGLPEPLCRLILQLLARQPEERLATALAVARVLQSLQSSAPVGPLAAPPAVIVPGSAADSTVAVPAVPVAAPPEGLSPRRQRWLWLGAAAALLLVVVVAAWPRKQRTARNEEVASGATETGSGERRPYVRLRPPEDAEGPAAAFDRRFRETWVPYPVPIAGLKGWCIETDDVGQFYPAGFNLGEDDQLIIYSPPLGWSRFDNKTYEVTRGPFDSQYIAVARDLRTGLRVVAGGVQLWDAGSSLPRVTFRSDGYRHMAAFSPDGKTVVTAALTGANEADRYLFWERKKGELLGEIKLHERLTGYCAWSADSKALASPTRSGRIVLFRPPWSAVAKTFDRPSAVSSIAWSPRGDLLATTEGDGLHLIDVEKGEDVGKLPALKAVPGCLAWSPDGKELAFGTPERTIQVWDPEKQKVTFTFTGHKRELTCIAFLMDGRTLVSGSKGSVRFWDLERKCLRGTLLQLVGGAWLAISPEGHYRCSPGGEGRFVHKVRQDDNELRDLPPDEFSRKYGWKNQPENVSLVGK